MDEAFVARAKRRLAKYAMARIADIQAAQHDQSAPYLAHGIWYLPAGSVRIPFATFDELVAYRERWAA